MKTVLKIKNFFTKNLFDYEETEEYGNRFYIIYPTNFKKRIIVILIIHIFVYGTSCLIEHFCNK